MSLYKGTSIEQDGRFINKDKKLLNKLEYPPEFDTRIKKASLNLKVIQSWVDKKLSDILGFEDECVSNYIINLIEDSEEYVDPKKIQYNITGFLDSNTYSFMQEFWKLLISAQNAPDGIPQELIKEKKEEILLKVQKQKEKLKFLDDVFGNNEENNKYKGCDVLIYEKENKKERRKNRSSSRSKSRRKSRSRSRSKENYNKDRNKSSNKYNKYSRDEDIENNKHHHHHHHKNKEKVGSTDHGKHHKPKNEREEKSIEEENNNNKREYLDVHIEEED